MSFKEEDLEVQAPPMFVTPSVFHVGYTEIDFKELGRYLKFTGQEQFIKAIEAAKQNGVSNAEILCSFYAKLCYRSLVMGQNPNISKVRSIEDNIFSCLQSAHMSVFEHANLNFVVTNCSRVFTHEMVRHRAGAAYAQSSGRYIRADNHSIVWDPILDPIKGLCEQRTAHDRAWYLCARMMMGLYETEDERRWFIENAQGNPAEIAAKIPNPVKDFDTKKKITSALRRFLPDGIANEIGITLNIRALRHVIQMRTSRYAEREIRYIFGQIFSIVSAKYPAVFSDAETETVDGILEVTGMKMQPYDKADEE